MISLVLDLQSNFKVLYPFLSLKHQNVQLFFSERCSQVHLSSPLPTFYFPVVKHKQEILEKKSWNSSDLPVYLITNEIVQRNSSLNTKQWTLPSSSTYDINSVCIWNLKKSWWMVTRWKSLRFKCAWILQLLYSWKLSLLIVAVIHCKTCQKLNSHKPGKNTELVFE